MYIAIFAEGCACILHIVDLEEAHNGLGSETSACTAFSEVKRQRENRRAVKFAETIESNKLIFFVSFY